MNRERMLAVADAIESHKMPDLGFNMETFYSRYGDDPDRGGRECGTVACLAGHTVAHAFGMEALQESFGSMANNTTYMQAMEYLDLDETQACALFLPRDRGDDADLEDSVETLRKLAMSEDGVVDWSHAS